MSDRNEPPENADPDVHSHYAHLYESRKEQLEGVVPFVRDGISAGEKCIYILGDRTECELATAFEVAGIDVAAERERGHLSFQDIEDTYLYQNDPSPESLREGMRTVLDREDDREQIRVTGEMVPALDVYSDLSVLEEYEAQIDEIVRHRAGTVTAMCQYDCRAFPNEFLREVLSYHPRVRSSCGSCENIFYRDHPLGGASPDARADVEHAMETLDRLARQRTHRSNLQQLTTLAESVEGLQACESAEVLATIADALEGTPRPAVLAFWSYDEETGRLEVDEVETTIQCDDPRAILDGLSDLAWETFAADAVRTDSLITSRAGSLEIPVDTCLSASLGRHGLVMALFPEHVTLSEADRMTVRTAVSNVRNALDSASYRDAYEEKTETLQNTAEHVRDLRAGHDRLRQAMGRIVDASSRIEIERTLCDTLVDSPQFECAWIGRYDELDETLNPSFAAPPNRTYVERVTGEADERELALATTAAERRQPIVRDDIHGDPPYELWREHALRQGFQSAMSLPLVYEEALYGTLTVFSAEAHAFDGRTRSDLRILGRQAAHAINARETKESLISDEVTELQLRIEDETLPTIHLATQLGTTVSFEGLVPRPDGPPRVYLTVHDCEPSRVESARRKIPSIVDLDPVTDRNEDQVFVCTVGSSCFFQRLLDHGGVPNELEATPGEAHVTVELPKRASVRSFLSMTEQRYDDVGLVSQRRRERSFRLRDEFMAAYEEELTPRQKEIVRTAYYSGFFESPREITGKDLADQLDVSQPTVTEHIRSAERKLFTLLLDEDSG